MLFRSIIGKEGRAAILREVAKGLQMPVDDVVPSREEMSYKDRLQADMQALQQQQGQTLPPLEPDGTPKGGQEANLVSGPGGAV